MRQLSLLNSYSLDCREGHMKKKSLCVCVFVCLFVSRSKVKKTSFFKFIRISIAYVQ